MSVISQKITILGKMGDFHPFLGKSMQFIITNLMRDKPGLVLHLLHMGVSSFISASTDNLWNSPPLAEILEIGRNRTRDIAVVKGRYNH